jgi:long-chain acyl-CoA synthetase
VSIHWPIIRRCLWSPRQIATIDETRTLTRAQLLIGAAILARDIQRTTKAKHVGLLLPATGGFALAALATWMAGRVVVPLNFLLKRDELEYVVRDSEIDTIYSVKPMLDFMGYRPEGATIRQLEEVNFKRMVVPGWPASPNDDDLGVLLYTSGTSGKPKGVMLSHGNIATNVRQCADHLGIRDAKDFVFLGCLPQFHSFGMTALTVLPLTVGARVVYAPRFVPQKIVKLFREHRPTVFIGIPSMYNALLAVRDAVPADFASLKLAVSGGEPLPDAVARAFKDRYGVTIAEGYGLTETSPVTNWCRPDEFRAHSVGRPLPGVEERIVDIDSGQDLGPDRDGEVRIKGPNLMKGYFKQPEASAAALDERGFLRTGDIGRFDCDGHLYITGRLKDMLIIAGENVFPREIEEALNAHPTIKASGVVGKRDPVRGELPVAFIELHEGAAYDEADVRKHLRERLANYKSPDEIRVLAELPRNPTGKIMRRELKTMV